MNNYICGVFSDKISPYNIHNSHKKHSLKVFFETDHFEDLSFSGPGLRVPSVTFRSRTDPREKLSCII
jgi:hypothetical protein